MKNKNSKPNDRISMFKRERNKKKLLLFILGSVLNSIWLVWSVLLFVYLNKWTDFKASFLPAARYFWMNQWDVLYEEAWYGYTIGTVFIFTPFYFVSLYSYELSVILWVILLQVCFMFVHLYFINLIEKNEFPLWLEILLTISISLMFIKHYDYRVLNLKIIVACFVVGFLWSSEKYKNYTLPSLFLTLAISFTFFLIPIAIFYAIKPFKIKKVLTLIAIFVGFNFMFIIDFSLFTDFVDAIYYFIEFEYNALYLSEYSLIIYFAYLFNYDLSLLGYILIFFSFLICLFFLDFKEYTMLYPMFLILFFCNFLIFRHYVTILPILYFYCVEYFGVEEKTRWMFVPFFCLIGLSFPIPIGWLLPIMPEFVVPLKGIAFIIILCIYLIAYKRNQSYIKTIDEKRTI